MTNSGTVLEIQARDPVNLSEWVQGLDVGPELNVLASVASRARAPMIKDAGIQRVPPATDPSKGSALVPHKGMLKLASIRR
ncbi:hypothetical protein GGF31_005268 [Allomyces arbusculus]|nr:hypothetical protein GGF31_005268 [Allomyces arbusculus]